MKNLNIKFLKEMNNAVEQIEKNCKELKNYLNIFESKDTEKYHEDFKDKVGLLSKSIETNDDPKNKQKLQEDLKQAIENYYNNILFIYENDFIKTIQEYNQKLHELKNKIIATFNPNDNSLNNDNDIDIGIDIDANFLNYNNFQNNYHCEGFSCIFNDDNINNQNEDDKEPTRVIEYYCTVCNQEEAIYLCDKCNQLFCQGCLDFIIKFDNKEKTKCEHNIQIIDDIIGQNEKSKKLYLNSLIYLIKSMMIKSNCLFDCEIIKSLSINDSKIEYIKKKYVKYPYIEKTNDFNSEIKFLKDINDILVNNYKQKI